MDMEGLVNHTFHMYDGLVGRLGNIQDNTVDGSVEEGEAEPVENRNEEPDLMETEPGAERNTLASEDNLAEEEMPDDDIPAIQHRPPTRHQLLEESARTPLFAGSSVTQLGSTLLLLNCLRTHGASNMLVNEVFSILSKSVLPKPNSLPVNEYQASKVLNDLGLAYDLIHCCPGPSTCILFRGDDYKDLEQCPKCQASRYKRVGKSKVPIKVPLPFNSKVAANV